jgi:hypothetical protein
VELINLMQSKKKVYVNQIIKSDFYAYHTAVRARGCGDRTVANNHQRVASWLRFAGIAAENIPAKPLYEEKLPTIYTSEQIRKLLDEKLMLFIPGGYGQLSARSPCCV